MEVVKVPDSHLVSVQQNSEAIEQFRINCQNLMSRLNALPNAESIDSTPDGKASTVLISHIETTLDEYFFGLWETENFRWSVIANEVVGSIDLVVLHPVTGQKLKRTGAAAIQIMVDKFEGDNRTEKNRWANDPSNKKPNALDMGFPKLKAECLKNAAQSLGKLFGRDLNRKKSDAYKPLISGVKVLYEDLVELYNLKKEGMKQSDIANANRIIDNRETNSYNKLYKILSEL